ncbi:MAG: polymer-forming cytoskeletal protein [Spirochaetales bacterium]|nr:polymer-forming cytoskeletal protein [Spirochaetales bacterium]
MKLKLFVIIMGILMCFPLFSLQIKTESGSSYTENGQYEEDYIFKGNELIFEGNATDLFFFGRKLIFNGSVNSGVYAIGETVEINGSIENDFFAGASKLEINGKIKGTLFMGSGECTLSDDSIINGNLFMGSGNIKVKGTVNGDIYAGTGVLSIDGTVNGNVKVGAGEIIITDNGRINGNFNYSTENKLNDSEEQRITGVIEYSEHATKKTEIVPFFMTFSIIIFILGLLSVLGSGLLLLLLPCLRDFNYAGSHKQFWYYLVYGLIPFFIYPMLIIVTMILIVTIPLGIIILLAGLPLLFVTLLLGITTFGQYLFRLFKWKNNNRFLYFLFGLVFYFLISLIPVIKILGVIFFSCIGWGIILEKIFKKKFVNNGLSTEQG